MKKSLLAVAAMTAFAGAAQAQSSVTVYGILDVGFTGISSRGADSSYSTGTPVTDAVNNTKVNSNSFNSGNSATSRLGFKGTEDLGGGLSGFFTAEMQLAPTESNSFGSSTSGMTNRQSFVGLAKKGLGNFAIGTQYTPIFNSMTATNPGQNNTVVGSIIYPLTSAAATNSEALTIRRNNALTVTSENFAGFSAQAMYSVANQDSTTTGNPVTAGGTVNSNGFGIGLNYTWNKFYATAAWQQNKQETSANATAATIAGLTANNTDNQYYVGATYDFGILKAYASWINRKVTSAVDSNAYVQRGGQQIGVKSFITPTIEAWANIGNGRFDSFGPGTPTANFNAWQLGSNYYLSKRTSLYGIFGKSQTSSTTNAVGLTTSAAASQYAVGVKHTF